MKFFRKRSGTKTVQAGGDTTDRFDLSADAVVEIEAAAEGESPKRPTFNIDAYSGGLLRVAAFYRPVVVDLAGLRAGRVTVLRDHDPSQIIGQGTAKVTKSKITVAGQVTGDHSDRNDPAYSVVAHSKNGFVWSASVGVSVERVEYVDAGAKVKVNGQTFTGPIGVVRAGRLGEVSFVGIGADETASGKIAATAAGSKENTMDEFKKWLTAKGWDFDALSEDQRKTLKAQFDAEQEPPADEPEEQPAEKVEAAAQTDPLDQERKVRAAEVRRVGAIQKVCANKHADIEAKAIEENWSVERTELEVLKASRPTPPAVHASQPVDAEPTVIEAALCMHGKLPGVEKAYGTEVLEAADKGFRHLGLQETLLMAAALGGYSGRQRISNGNVRQVLHAAFSTMSLPGILSNVANKFLLDSFNAVESVWRRIAAIRSVSDFKTVTSYRMTGTLEYEQVGPDGEIKHGKVDEESFTNKADTYGKMLSITRTDIINDDLGALTSVPAKLGRGGALKLNDVFWTAFLNNSAFFKSANKNVSTSSALSIAGLTKAIVVFRKQTDSDGKPLGITPEILLVPVDLEVPAGQLYNDRVVNEVTAEGKPAPNGNPHAAKYTPVASSYLSNSKYTGYSTTSYYLLANPASLAVIEIAFLNGQENPTVETAEADFNTLGIQMRGYHDFGVSLQEPKAGVKATA